MAPINQINRLTKLPHLLNKKRDAEEKAKKNRQEKEESPPFPPEDKPFLKKSGLNKLKKSQKKEGNPKSADDNVGSNLDLTV